MRSLLATPTRMTLLKWTLIVIGGLAVLVLAAGRMGLLAGRAPANLGVSDGRLKPPSRTPNSVSSQAGLWPDHPRHAQAQIAPLALAGDGRQTMERLRVIVQAMPGATVVRTSDDYLYVQFTSRAFGFVDDTEFWLDAAAQVIQVRSASRVGRRDFDVNRQRIEAIRARLAG